MFIYIDFEIMASNIIRQHQLECLLVHTNLVIAISLVKWGNELSEKLSRCGIIVDTQYQMD